jgi:NhaP-type Na+/H+ or K+/H+ antiporter
LFTNPTSPSSNNSLLQIFLSGDEVFLNLPKSWTNQIKAFGLCIIFIRSGLELDIPAIIKQGMVSMRLTVCPGIVEALVVGGVAAWRFEMPFDLAGKWSEV